MRNPENKLGKRVLGISLWTGIIISEFSTEILTYFEWKAPGHRNSVSVISDLVVITHVDKVAASCCTSVVVQQRTVTNQKV